jgi:carnitine monooxygenase subunit
MDTIVRPRGTSVTSDPSHSHSLPGWAYLDPDIFEREKEEIFFKTWQYAGWVGDLKAPGDYITRSLIDQSVIILKGANGELQGFHNVCQHRGHQLLAGRGHIGSVTCPYHAWTYQLDGTLKTARGAEKLQGFNAAQFHLKPVRVETLADKFVFFNLDVGAKPLAELAPGLGDDIKSETPTFDALVRNDLRSDDGFSAVQNANWKIVVDNSQECYHCRAAHPGFSAHYDMAAYTSESFGYWARQRGEPRIPTKSTYTETTGAKNNKVRFWWLFPNTTFSMRTTDPVTINLRSTIPITITRTGRGAGDTFLLPGMVEQPNPAPLTASEDMAINESVQRGLASKGYDSGRFIYDPDHNETSEEIVHGFHRLVVEALKL